MKQIACIGDSNTFGFDPRSLWGGCYARDIRWTDRLAAAGFKVHNFGQNGLGVSRESLHPVLVQELLLVQPLSLASVMLGSNDLLLGLSAAETTRSMKKLLSLMIEKKAAESFCLIAPVSFQPGGWAQDAAVIAESRALSACYRRLAADLGIRFADADRWGIPLAFDGVHFTEEGHRLFADNMLRFLSDPLL